MRYRKAKRELRLNAPEVARRLVLGVACPDIDLLEIVGAESSRRKVDFGSCETGSVQRVCAIPCGYRAGEFARGHYCLSGYWLEELIGSANLDLGYREFDGEGLCSGANGPGH